MGIKIHSKAPTRIDLAGGTIDLWPIYLFLDHPTTINLAIDLAAEVWLEEDGITADQGAVTVTLRSEDQSKEQKFTWSEIKTISVPPQLELHLKLLRLMAQKYNVTPHGNITLRTRAGSPAGAGLGGSSTLSVALVGALTAWARGGHQPNILVEGTALLDIVRDVETTVIQVPAGVQDYYGAMFGGVQSLRWGAGVHEREWLPSDLIKELQSRIALFYSGQSRNSGINNWALFKAFIDRQDGVRERFALINQAARDLETALRIRDWNKAGVAIRSEWAVRHTLAAGISTPEIDRAFELAKKVAPESAGKICGAGGGGCFFIYSADPADKTKIEKALEGQPGIRPLPYHAMPHGLEVEVSRG
jgi:D-glycero-alpha-D-manno-heptose-7-phosphate kinase